LFIGQPLGAAASRRVQIKYLKKSGCPLCRNQYAKIFPCAALPSLSRISLESRQKGKFCPHQNLPLEEKNQGQISMYF
jgi:hypothetical protein